MLFFLQKQAKHGDDEEKKVERSKAGKDDDKETSFILLQRICQEPDQFSI